jgi:ABC-type bacteriocin/lantibiotic exporter with double-glycine peptidase domain
MVVQDQNSPMYHPLRSVWLILRRDERRKLIGLFVLTLIGVALDFLSLGAVLPVMTTLVQDDLSLNFLWLSLPKEESSRSTILSIALASMTGLVLLKNLFLLWSSWLQYGFSADLNVRLSTSLFRNYLLKPFSFHTRHGSAELISNTQNANLVITGALTPVMTLLSDILVALSLFLLLILVEPLATLAAISTFGVFSMLFQRATRKRIDAWGNMGITLRRRSISLLQEGFAGIKELKVLAREQNFVDRFEEAQRKLASANRKFGLLQGVPKLVLETMALTGLSVLVVVMASTGRSGAEILPVVALFAASAFRIAPSVNRVITALQQIRFALPSIRVIESELLFPINDEMPRRSGLEFERFEMKGVSFSHEGRSKTILNGLDFTLRRGELVGIMGESGVGKSTFLDIFLGLFHQIGGEVLVNGAEIASQLRDWHRIVGYVPQHVFLSDATIRSNVALGLADRDIDEAAVVRALRLAQLDEFVRNLEDGLDTVVGERGIRLSGGQRQRVGIARALYGIPDILVFDEATSSLDSQTERAFLQSISDLKTEYTMLVIAHRKTTLKDCSRILVLEGGKLQPLEAD